MLQVIIVRGQDCTIPATELNEAFEAQYAGKYRLLESAGDFGEADVAQGSPPLHVAATRAQRAQQRFPDAAVTVGLAGGSGMPPRESETLNVAYAIIADQTSMRIVFLPDNKGLLCSFPTGEPDFHIEGETYARLLAHIIFEKHAWAGTTEQ